ncbi:MAG: hypothetical protein ACRETX_13630, partial [Steroidobacteraceae bacterium]
MVPEDASPLELLLIFTMFRALRGNEGCRRDILDRVEAKQARVEGTPPWAFSAAQSVGRASTLTLRPSTTPSATLSGG